MSVLLSILGLNKGTAFIFISLYSLLTERLLPRHGANKAFQIVGFRDAKQNGMVAGLSALFDDASRPVDIDCGRGDHLNEIRLAHMKRAGTCDQDPLWTQHFKRSQVQLFVATHGGLKVLFRSRKGRRIEHDYIVLPAGNGVVL